MKLIEIDQLEFQNYVEKQDCNNFFQTKYMYQRYIENNQEVYLLGLYDNNQLVGTTMVVATGKFLNKKIFSAYKGFICNYNDSNIIKLFTEKIKLFIKEKNGFILTIDPYIPLISRDTDGNITEEFNHTNIHRELLKYYKYIGVGEQVKWTYCVDTNKDIDTLYKELKPNTRNKINKTINKFKLEIKTLTYDELNIFKEITQDTSSRRSFSDKPLSYYQQMYNIFKDKVLFKIAILNCNTYLESLNNDISEYQKKHDSLSDSGSNKKLKSSLLIDIENTNKRITKLKELQNSIGNEIILSGAMFILYGKEIVYLFSGSYEEHMEYSGQYLLQWDMIKHASENNYQRYNFYGISGNFNKDSKDYGVYEFKKGYGGYVEELLGTYELPCSNTYKIYKILKKIKSLLRR